MNCLALSSRSHTVRGVPGACSQPRESEAKRNLSLMLPKRSQTGPEGNSFFKASSLCQTLPHFPISLFPGRHENTGLSVLRGSSAISSTPGGKMKEKAVGLCTDACQGF